MDDNDLLAAVRRDFAGVRMTTRADAILADGAALRRRRHRRRAYGAGATALAAVAAVSAVALTPGSSGTGVTGNAQLTAWTVQKQPDGSVDVTIRDVLNIAGLQRELNAEGVPAVVYAGERNPPGCVNTKASGHMSAVVDPGPRTDDAFFVIHPAAIPAGSELLLDVFWANVPQDGAKRMAAFGVKRGRAWSSHGGAATTPGALAWLATRMDIVYANSDCR